jgi:heme exporter protein A
VTEIEPAIRAEALHKSFGGRRILNGLSLELCAGECLGLLGGNGAGKSTLLRILGGTTRPTAGRIEVFGETLHGDKGSESRGKIGFLGHESMLYRDLNPRENLEVFASLYRLPNPAIRERLDRVGLGHVGNRPTRTLSRGMLQRLALARATLHDPSILLLDEPFTGLDDNGASLLREILHDHTRKGGATLLISHALPEVAQLCSRGIILDRGAFACELPEMPDVEALRGIYRQTLQSGPS